MCDCGSLGTLVPIDRIRRILCFSTDELNQLTEGWILIFVPLHIHSQLPPPISQIWLNAIHNIYDTRLSVDFMQPAKTV